MPPLILIKKPIRKCRKANPQSGGGPADRPAGIPLAREQRKLAAIMAADVVGYARLMGRDEAGTLLRLKKWRGDCPEPTFRAQRMLKLASRRPRRQHVAAQ
jgi:hypothetical protein